MQERWDECLRNWEKIDGVMTKLQFPKFGSPRYFQDIGDIMKHHIENDHEV
jgi:hypothetical protein